MVFNTYPLLRPLLFCLDAERAHHLALRWMQMIPDAVWQAKRRFLPAAFHQPRMCMGIRFTNPLGLAAGFDKNAECIPALAALGFGFVEVGTVVPQPQPGNPRPRLFRLSADQALINRFGFNSKGLDYVVQRLRQRPKNITVGVNIGKNRLTPLADAGTDYVRCMQQLYPHADYITVNISSPNTPQLRQLASNIDFLRDLLCKISQAQASLQQQHGYKVPLLLKLSPDEKPGHLAQLVENVLRYQMDGVIIANTTVSRPGENSALTAVKHAAQTGGLSGKPLLSMSNRMLIQVRELVGDSMPIMGAGGIHDIASARSKLDAGADLLQLYTGFIYQGPVLLKRILQGLLDSA